MTANFHAATPTRAALFCLLAVLALAAAGCAGVDQVADARQFTITLWTQDTWLGITGHELDGGPLDDSRRALYTYRDWYAKVTRDFAALYPELTIDFQIEVLDWITGFQKLEIAVASGLPPDIMVSTSGIALKYARFGLLEAFDDYLDEEDIADFGPFYEFSAYEGRHYFLPFIGGSRYLTANLQIFREREAAHLLPSEGDRLWTFDQFLDAARATTFDRDGDGAIDVYGFALPFQRSAPQQQQMPFFWGHGATMFNADGDSLTIASDEAVAALQFIVDLEHEHRVVPPGSAGLRNNDVEDMWNQGRVAMRMGHHGTLVAHRRALETGALDPGIVELYQMMYPSLPGVEPRVFVVADSPCVFRQSDPRKRELVIELAKFMTNTKHEREATYAMTTLPTRHSASDVWEDDPFQQYVLRVTKYGTRDGIQGYGIPLVNMTRASLQAAMSRQLTPREALADFVRRGNRFIVRDIERRERAL